MKGRNRNHSLFSKKNQNHYIGAVCKLARNPARPTQSHSWMTEALLMAATHTESLLNDESTPDGQSKSYIGSSSWQLRPIRSRSWMMKALLMVATYTESLLNDRSALDGHFYGLYRVLTLRVDLQWDSPERWKRYWRSLWQPISVPHLDSSDLYGVTPERQKRH